VSPPGTALARQRNSVLSWRKSGWVITGNPEGPYSREAAKGAKNFKCMKLGTEYPIW